MSFLSRTADIQQPMLSLSSIPSHGDGPASAYNVKPNLQLTDALAWVVLLMAAGLLSVLLSSVAVGAL